MIKIRVADSIKMNGEYSLFVSFPFNNRIVSVIRELPSRYWNADTLEWEVPFNKFSILLNKLSDFEFEIVGKYVDTNKPKITAPEGFEFKTKPFAHQLEGFDYGLNNDRWLLGDEQGLGKTKQVIDIAVAKKLQKGYKHCLIICGVNSLKWNWQAEIKTHSNEDSWILGQYRKVQDKHTGKFVWNIGSNNDKLDDLNKLGKDIHLDSHYFLITNIETLRDKRIADKLKNLCDKGVIEMVVCDEVHKCFEYNTPILTKEGKEYLIGDIVTKHMNVEVLSYNNKTKEYEYKPITGGFENVVAKKLIKLTIQLNNGTTKIIECTPEHRIYTYNRGWVMAKDLTETDDILEC